MRGVGYQITLITAGVVATTMFAVFLYREIFPEYKIFQDDYIALEAFRFTYSDEPPAAFQTGVKQIVFEREDKGPPKIDRCISCHVAEEVPQFSPTKISRDASGNIVRSPDGTPVKEPNEEYVWAKLDQKIAELKKEQKLEEADQLASLKVARVGAAVYNVEKVLSMHPLIGKETRPFEYHSIEEYGCTSCHGGNGRGLTVEKAHGPVFDGEYDVEYMGPQPEFTEKDSLNDPQFAYVFNHKPGPNLVFQTTPILVGALIQANCIQCHEQNAAVLKNFETSASLIAGETEQSALSKTARAAASDMDKLTKDYLRGEQLYLSQACYACHRVSGLARGGVGPDLTYAGDNYPWYLKQKIVWPQGDLPTSTMPNYRLDHIELEDLMTFLLAQKGRTKAISDIDYKVDIKEWEQGRKLPWENPIPPSEVHNLRYSMTVFVTQGCAACHRLEGFESNVGFQIEKKETPSFLHLYRERKWFQALFPEDIHGSAIVKAIDQHAEEIDKRILDDVRKGSLLEEIENKYPEVIESMYTNFRYALRAKNYVYNEMASRAANLTEAEEASKKLDVWEKRVKRILMVYIQEYGFGHLIGPRPNWSGVYRSDEWLMEHFRNPASHTPKSIMPIFPFDDTKFYALTYMLDRLGIRNRDNVREIWKHRGFNPAEAFHIHCAQCHGEYLQGNGPVAEWIYPVPKNLRNQEFLRNLTKANAIQSITHGVKGTPMPPWGEAPKDKETYDGIPILNKEEIAKLVDWIFGSLPGGEQTPTEKFVPKWQYSPKDVLHELNREGSKLKSGDYFEPHESGSLLKGEPKFETHIASAFQTGESHLTNETDPVVDPKDNDNGEISQVFDIVPDPIGKEKYAYYIKKKYYTEENIESGKRFFEMNCAVCHGPEADGSGIRASVMADAKPRMLTNLDWLKTRDDLRLLRSIKYGVPGTAMTPWGDFTSSLQRIQLVLFIRSLSNEKEQRDSLSESLYQAFDRTALVIEDARMKEYVVLSQLQTQLEQLKNQEQSAFKKAESNQEHVQQALDIYRKQLTIAGRLYQHQKLDDLLIELKKLVLKEKDIYQSIGNDIIASNLEGDLWQAYLQVFALRTRKEKNNLQKENAIKKIEAIFNFKLKEVEREIVITQAKIASPEKLEALHSLQAKLKTYNKLKANFVSGLEQVGLLESQESELVDEIQKKQRKLTLEPVFKMGIT